MGLRDKMNLYIKRLALIPQYQAPPRESHLKAL